MSETSTALIGEPARESDTRLFRDALGQFATGVAIITARSPDYEDLGMTASSFTAVSLRPPLVLFCIDRRAYSLSHWLDATSYGVSVLAEGQDRLASQFAKPLGDKWANVHFRRGQAGIPLISGATAHFECHSRDQIEGGDHIMFVAEVLRYHVHRLLRPLVFCQGRYNELRPTARTLPDWPLAIHY